jgi:hypothetical protein
VSKSQLKQSWIECYSQLLTEHGAQIRPLIPDDGCMYRMLGKQCAATLVAGTDHMLKELLQ